MERFVSISLDDFGARYKNKDLALVLDLLSAGLLHGAPTCHGKPMKILESKPWHWRCTTSTYCKTTGVITDDCFLKGSNDRYAAMKAVYMWCFEFSPSQIRQECQLSAPTLRKLIKRCREVVLPDGVLHRPIHASQDLNRRFARG